jgi:hypothetical protein
MWYEVCNRSFFLWKLTFLFPISKDEDISKVCEIGIGSDGKWGFSRQSKTISNGPWITDINITYLVIFFSTNSDLELGKSLSSCNWQTSNRENSTFGRFQYNIRGNSIDYTPLVSSRFYYWLVMQTVHEEIINASLSLEVVVQLTIGESFTTVLTSTLNFERLRSVLKTQGSYK